MILPERQHQFLVPAGVRTLGCGGLQDCTLERDLDVGSDLGLNMYAHTHTDTQM